MDASHPPKRAADLVLENIGELLTLEPELGDGPLGILEGAAVAMHEGQVTWLGSSAAWPQAVALAEHGDCLDMGGRVVTPGLVDAHTHLVFAGGRESEFALRVQGATYQEIAAAGGGILSTMKATRAAGFDELLDLGLERLALMLRQGVTTCEIKSGYGLSVEHELRILEVIRTLGMSQPMGVVATFLGAHTLPPEFKSNREGYVEQLVNTLIPRVAEEGLAEFCDVFCERGVFSVEESRLILRAAREAGLQLKLHADQLSSFGGAALAAELRAVSADHLEYASPEALAAMADAGTVAVLLPGAAFFLGQAFPSVQPLRDAGLRMAIASDFNPGTSPTSNLLLCATMAAVRMGMSPVEVMRAVTLDAAAALGQADRIGSLREGKQGDLAVFDVSDYRSLLVRFGENHCSMVLKEGAVVVP